MIIFSDLHCNLNHPIIGDNFIKLSQNALQQIREFAIKEKENNIIHCGDWTHLKDRIYNKVWETILKELAIWENLNINSYWLMGNHDFDTEISIKVFNIFKKTNIITSIQNFNIEGQNCLFIPYNSFNNSLNLSEYNIIFLHEYFKNITTLANNIVSVNGVDLNMFNENQFVFSGHSHKFQEIQKGKKYHIGSPYQVSFNEINQEKYFIQFVNGEVKIHSFNFPHFLEIDLEKDDLETQNINNSYIKIKYNKNKITFNELKEIKKQLLEKGAIKICAEAKKTITQRKERIKITHNNEEYLKQYIKIKNKDLDNKLLLNIGKKLIGNISNEAN